MQWQKLPFQHHKSSPIIIKDHEARCTNVNRLKSKAETVHVPWDGGIVNCIYFRNEKRTSQLLNVHVLQFCPSYSLRKTDIYQFLYHMHLTVYISLFEKYFSQVVKKLLEVGFMKISYYITQTDLYIIIQKYMVFLMVTH